MRKIAIIALLFIASSIEANEAVWTQNTKSMPKAKSEKIIQEYMKNSTLPVEIEFEDDAPASKTLGIYDNIFVIGATLGYLPTTETLSNTNGSKDESYAISRFQLSVGKDFTLWHEKYVEASRLFLNISYNILSTDLSSSSITFGLQENMSYWPLYTSGDALLFPLLSYELGSSTINRSNLSITGFTTELSAGLMYQDTNLEYSVKAVSSSVSWTYPVEGIADDTNSLGLVFGVTYKFMYEDFR